jgi:hypothetical protein
MLVPAVGLHSIVLQVPYASSISTPLRKIYGQLHSPILPCMTILQFFLKLWPDAETVLGV